MVSKATHTATYNELNLIGFINYDRLLAVVIYFEIMNEEQNLQEQTNPALNIASVMPSCLHMPLKTKWFEMTKAGIKNEDYREVNHYWVKRLMTKKYNTIYPLEQEAIDGILKHIYPKYLVKNHSKKFDINVITLGYPKKGDTERILKLEHKGIEIRTGNPEWGAEPNKLYFVIMHGAIIA